MGNLTRLGKTNLELTGWPELQREERNDNNSISFIYSKNTIISCINFSTIDSNNATMNDMNDTASSSKMNSIENITTIVWKLIDLTTRIENKRDDTCTMAIALHQQGFYDFKTIRDFEFVDEFENCFSFYGQNDANVGTDKGINVLISQGIRMRLRWLMLWIMHRETNRAIDPSCDNPDLWTYDELHEFQIEYRTGIITPSKSLLPILVRTRNSPRIPAATKDDFLSPTNSGIPKISTSTSTSKSKNKNENFARRSISTVKTHHASKSKKNINKIVEFENIEVDFGPLSKIDFGPLSNSQTTTTITDTRIKQILSSLSNNVHVECHNNNKM